LKAPEVRAAKVTEMIAGCQILCKVFGTPACGMKEIWWGQQVVWLNLKFSVGRFRNDQDYEKNIFQNTVHPKSEQRYDAYSTMFFTFCCVAIRYNNSLLRLIAPCQK